MPRGVDLDLIDLDTLDDLIDETKFNPLHSPNDFKRLIVQAIGIVHAVASKLHTAGQRNELVMYFGRSGCTAEHLYGRWKNRQNRYGVILARVPTREVVDAERDTIRLFRTLDAGDHGLCIKRLINISESGCGNLPSTSESLIYLTWAFEGPGVIGKIPTCQIPEVAEEIYERLIWNLSKQSIRTILQMTREYSYLVPLRWYKGHPE